ncbi:hypothetical protein PSEUBRA_002372 [Kalmanozyma brasiliensis GHG001]|uniref:uncharacterized protein n=1 Tax=Kalmanozyma brasiliensis (strain GHG001) TaxID=1365824 RepID=UPI001CEAF46D|nr:uncharacterized protein PSEUBRA_002372 [Kalmanozyma brasiliensis GHG001]KAF6767077.1 hypothetical protein PSEUBRA_002372 [Kalmanozyma brasiliensis GHG001]
MLLTSFAILPLALLVLSGHAHPLQPALSLPTVQEKAPLADAKFIPFNPSIETIHPLLQPSPSSSPSRSSSRWSRLFQRKKPQPAEPVSIPLFRVSPLYDGVSLPGTRMDTPILEAMKQRGAPFFVIHPRGKVTFIRSNGGTIRLRKGAESEVVLGALKRSQSSGEGRMLTLPSEVVTAAQRRGWWDGIVEGGGGVLGKVRSGIRAGWGRVRVP